MEAPSLKKTLIDRLSVFSIPNEQANNKLVLVTGAGLITGELDTGIQEGTLSGIDVIAEFIDKTAVEYKESLGIDASTPLSDNDGVVLLRNVTITRGNSVISLPILAVFFDQIIAVSIGNHSN